MQGRLFLGIVAAIWECLKVEPTTDSGSEDRDDGQILLFFLGGGCFRAGLSTGGWRLLLAQFCSCKRERFDSLTAQRRGPSAEWWLTLRGLVV